MNITLKMDEEQEDFNLMDSDPTKVTILFIIFILRHKCRAPKFCKGKGKKIVQTQIMVLCRIHCCVSVVYLFLFSDWAKDSQINPDEFTALKVKGLALEYPFELDIFQKRAVWIIKQMYCT